MGTELLIVVALLGLGLVLFFVLRPKPKAVGAAGDETRKAVGAAGDRREKAQGAEGDRALEAAKPEEPKPEEPKPEEPKPEEPKPEEPKPEEPKPEEPKPEEPKPEEPEPAKAKEEAAPAKEEPRHVRPKFFTPPPLPGQPRPEPTLAPTPARAVPLPVDKPKVAPSAGQSDAARREQDRERYRKGLEKTRGGFVAKLARLFKGKPKVDANLREQIEEVLFTADIGTSTAEKLQARVTQVLDSKEVADPDAVWSVIRQAMLELLELPAPAPDYAPEPGPYVLLMIGVNGVGKTTTLGKLAAQHAAAGRKVLLVAGDTFRAAAVEQLDVWARRVGCEIHTGADKADPSSVIFEGIARGRREGFDVVLCDTAGRLHTRKELMDELAKVGRAAAKAIAKGLPEPKAAAVTGAHDIFLVLDATIGQNALAQAQLFKETMGFSGLVVTKLDGTAKGGVVLGICDELRIPIRYIGIGEGIDDLRAFDAEGFVDALLVDRDRVDAPATP